MSIPINDSENNYYKEGESIVLNLETLRAQYKNLLIQYKQAVLDYVNYLREETMSNSPRIKSLTVIPGQTFWGTSGISQTETTTIKECKMACANDLKCSGATFNSSKNLCWLRSGKSQPIPATSDEFAIMMIGDQLLLIIDGINKQLIRVNEKILSVMNSSSEVYDDQQESRELNKSTMEKNYNDLVSERERIEHLLLQYRDLDKTQQDTGLVVNKNYYTFLLLLGLVILASFLLVKFTVETNLNTSIPVPVLNGDLGKNAYYIVFGIIIVTVIVYFISKKFGV